jgi:DNA (cytosine-5)-methyltransferase 1
VVFDEVQADLETEGYEVLPFLLPACAVNAPHRRDRIWFIAYSDMSGWGQSDKENAGGPSKQFDCDSFQYDAAHTYNDGLQGRWESYRSETTGRQAIEFDASGLRDRWDNFPTQSPICGRNDGVRNRVDRIKALGNAVVPQVVYQIFKAIEQSKTGVI